MESKADQRDLVIKVKYGESLKRFTATITAQNSLNQTIATLRSKIASAFSFPPSADFVLTYTDSDGDSVLLSDDEDLTDAAIKQQLNPLRISVELKGNPNPNPNPNPSGSEGEVRGLNPNLIISSLEEALKSLPVPLNRTISKVTEDIVSKATSGPVLAELLNAFSKLTVPETQTQTQTPQPNNNNNSNNSNNTSNNNEQAKVSPADPSKETKKNPTSDKPEPSNAQRGPHFYHRRGNLPPNPPFFAPPPPFIPPPPFMPLCRGMRNNNNNNNNQNGQTENNNGNNTMPFRMRYFPVGHPYRKADEGLLEAVHRGIQCDGCDVTPIVGPRFKSIVKDDYDLCSACFTRMGNEAEYTRIDHPDPHRIFRDLSHHRHSNYGGPSAVCPMRPKRSYNKLESRFIQDVTVLDGTLMAPLTPFTKIWRMRNNGSTVWPFGTQLVWVGGDQFSSQISAQLEVPVNGFPVDQEVDIAVDFCAPARAGRYVSYWRLASPSGQKFGQRVWVLIQVEQPDNNEDVKSAINLNLPPDSSMFDAIEMMDMNEPSIETETAPKIIKPKNVSYPVVDGPFSPNPKPFVSQPNPVLTQPEPIMTQPNPILTQPEPIATQPNPILTQREPILTQPERIVTQPEPNVTQQPMPAVAQAVPVAQAEPVTVHHEPSPFSSYPLIDLSSSSSSSAPPLINSDKTQDNEEEILLKELEQMGFKQVDLNKEVLRLNKYDLEQSVEDLCGFSEWDPLLEELKEMGFEDKEANKKLLVKNGGSIKRVVMDLIAGEKDKAE